MRFALTRPVKINVMEAGEKLFVDLMPEKWVGMPPPLPADVIADLTSRARAAGQAERELATLKALPVPTLKVSAGSNADRMRVSLQFSASVDVEFKADGTRASVVMPLGLTYDVAAARAALPPDITDFMIDKEPGGLVLRFSAPAGSTLRGQAEDRAFSIDVVPSKPAAAAAPPVACHGRKGWFGAEGNDADRALVRVEDRRRGGGRRDRSRAGTRRPRSAGRHLARG